MADPIRSDDGDWLTSMFDLQSDLAKRAVNECNRLRRRVIELEGQLASGMAADLTATQDRITQLEQLLAAERKAGVAAAPAISRETIAEWREEQGKGMASAIGEYTPPEFWELLDAYEALARGVDTSRANQPKGGV
jgi:hypothetical protein